MNNYYNKVISELNKPKIRFIIVLALSSLLSCTFVLMRINYSNRITYLFMIWNLFLAWIPLVLALIISKLKTHTKINKIIQYILTILWFLFLPNSFYIITDLFHLHKLAKGVPLWFDLIMIISFAWNGMMLGYYSLLIIQQNLMKTLNSILSWTVISIIILLTSFGIYIGRYQRWNSWDVFANPYDLILDIGQRITNPFTYPGLLGLTLTFSLFFIVGYMIFAAATNLSNNQKT